MRPFGGKAEETALTPCRHHVIELILKAAVEIYWKVTSGPNMLLFQRSQKEWNSIDQTRYKSGLEDEIVAEMVGEKTEEILTFVTNQLEVQIFTHHKLHFFTCILIYYHRR